MCTTNERRMYTRYTQEHKETCFHSDSDSAVKAVMYYIHWLIHIYMTFLLPTKRWKTNSVYIQCFTIGSINIGFIFFNNFECNSSVFCLGIHVFWSEAFLFLTENSIIQWCRKEELMLSQVRNSNIKQAEFFEM